MRVVHSIEFHSGSKEEKLPGFSDECVRTGEQYRGNKKCLPITLSIPNPKDYRSIVSYYAGDC